MYYPLIVSLPLFAGCAAVEVVQFAASSPIAPHSYAAAEGSVATPAAAAASAAAPASAAPARQLAAPAAAHQGAATPKAASSAAGAGAGTGAATVASTQPSQTVAAAQPASGDAALADSQAAGGSLRGKSGSSGISGLTPDFSTLLAGLTFAAVVKSSCMASNVMVQLSPFPQVKRWSSRGCTGDADAAPYVSIFFGGWQWCYYGLFAFFVTGRSGFLILVQSNALGAMLGSFYIFTFFRNCGDKQTQGSLQTYLTVVSSLVLVQASALAVLPSDRALFLSGLVASFCSFLGALSMLVTVPAVLSSENSRSIPGPLVTANFFSAMVWCLCGWMLSDPMVLAPNVAAMATSGTCIYLKQRYPSDQDGDACKEDAPIAKQACAIKLAPKLPSECTAFARGRAPSMGACSPSGKSPLAAQIDDFDRGETGGTC